MNCPKCEHPTEAVAYEGIEIDRCTNCGGLWFDALEAEHLKEMKGSEAIDTGEAEVGQVYDESRLVSCPKCRVAMIRMSDPEQPHIHFESCPTCYGVFFDAGEFRDYREHTVMEFLKGLWNRG